MTVPQPLEPSQPQATRVRYGGLSLLCLAAAIAYIQRNCIGVAESTISAELELSKEQMGWIMGGFFFTYSMFQIPSGLWSDRKGARLTLSLYATFWSLSTAVMGLANGFVTLVAARFVSGVAQAGIFPCSAITIGKWFPPSRRAFASGWIAAAQQVGAVLATILTGYLISSGDQGLGLSWRWVFVLFAVPGFLWAAWFYYWFRDRPDQHSGVNAAELKFILAQPDAVETEGAAEMPGSPQSADDEASSQPVWKTLFFSPEMWCICGQQFFRAIGYIFYASWFPTFLQETRGVSVIESGFLTSLPLIGSFLGCLIGGTLSDWLLNKTGNRNLSRKYFSALFLFLCAVLIFMAYFVADPTLAVLVISAGSLCAAMAGPPAYVLPIEMGGSRVATIFASMNMSGNIGAFIFPIAIPYLLKLPGKWDLVLFCFAGVYVASALCWLFINPDKPIFAETED